MKRLAIVLLIMLIATTVIATERTKELKNPNAFNHNAESPAINDSQFPTIIQSRDTMIIFDVADFVALLNPDFYFDDYSDMDWGTISDTDTYQFGPINGYSFTAFVEGGVFSIPGAISTNSQDDSIVLTFDGAPVFAVGGDFFGTDFDGNVIPSLVSVALADGTEVLLELPAVFAGFVSTEPITQLTISNSGSASAYLAFDNFYVGQQGTVATGSETWGNLKALYK